MKHDYPGKTGDRLEGVIDGREYEYPHCNSETLHAPGVCDYCDQFPSRQKIRAASGSSFSTPEANGWYGNVAFKNDLPPTCRTTEPWRDPFEYTQSRQGLARRIYLCIFRRYTRRARTLDTPD